MTQSSRLTMQVRQAPPPPSMVVRKSLIAEIGEHVRHGEHRFTVIVGAPGVGKSTLASAIAHDGSTIRVLPDGVLWATVGQDPNCAQILNSWIHLVGGADHHPFSAGAATSYLRSLLSDKRFLIVLDDVWNSEVLEHFDVGPLSKILVTTRREQVGEHLDSRFIRIEPLYHENNEAIELLLHKINSVRLQGPIASIGDNGARELVRAAGYLPLAINLLGALLGKGHSKENVLTALGLGGDLHRELHFNHLDKCISTSLEFLKGRDPETWQRAVRLGVLRPTTAFSKVTAQALWRCPPPDANLTLTHLVEDSLVERSDSSYRLHAAIQSYLRRVLLSPSTPVTEAEINRQFIGSYFDEARSVDWRRVTEDPYFMIYAAEHLDRAEDFARALALLWAQGQDGGNGWYTQRQRLGQIDRYLVDLDIVEQLGRRTGKATLADVSFLSLLRSTIYSLASGVVDVLTVDRLKMLVRRGIWSPMRAFSVLLTTPVCPKRTLDLLDVLTAADERGAPTDNEVCLVLNEVRGTIARYDAGDREHTTVAYICASATRYCDEDEQMRYTRRALEILERVPMGAIWAAFRYWPVEQLRVVAPTICERAFAHAESKELAEAIVSCLPYLSDRDTTNAIAKLVALRADESQRTSRTTRTKASKVSKPPTAALAQANAVKTPAAALAIRPKDLPQSPQSMIEGERDALYVFVGLAREHAWIRDTLTRLGITQILLDDVEDGDHFARATTEAPNSTLRDRGVEPHTTGLFGPVVENLLAQLRAVGAGEAARLSEICKKLVAARVPDVFIFTESQPCVCPVVAAIIAEQRPDSIFCHAVLACEDSNAGDVWLKRIRTEQVSRSVMAFMATYPRTNTRVWECLFSQFILSCGAGGQREAVSALLFIAPFTGTSKIDTSFYDGTDADQIGRLTSLVSGIVELFDSASTFELILELSSLCSEWWIAEALNAASWKIVDLDGVIKLRTIGGKVLSTPDLRGRFLGGLSIRLAEMGYHAEARSTVAMIAQTFDRAKAAKSLSIFLSDIHSYDEAVRVAREIEIEDDKGGALLEVFLRAAQVGRGEIIDVSVFPDEVWRQQYVEMLGGDVDLEHRRPTGRQRAPADESAGPPSTRESSAVSWAIEQLSLLQPDHDFIAPLRDAKDDRRRLAAAINDLMFDRDQRGYLGHISQLGRREFIKRLRLLVPIMMAADERVGREVSRMLETTLGWWK